MRSLIKKSFDFKRFFIGEGPVNPPYLLTQRRVYILPTRQGITFTVLLIIMLLGSINYSNSLGYFLTFLLSSLFVISIFHTYNNLLKLSIGPAICKPVFADQIMNIPITINNTGKNRFSVQIFSDETNLAISDLEAGNYTTVYLNHCFKQRGMNPLPRMTIQTTYPLGLFRSWTYVELNQSVLTYPAPSTHTNLPINQPGQSEGIESNSRGNDDFKSLRTFHEGDPLQHVHWKSYARHQNLLTKEFTGYQSRELWLNWSDTNVSSIEGKISQITRWVLLAKDSGLNYGLRLPGQEVKPSRGKSHDDYCLKLLALFKNAG